MVELIFTYQLIYAGIGKKRFTNDNQIFRIISTPNPLGVWAIWDADSNSFVE
jgi:hypothetical protein